MATSTTVFNLRKPAGSDLVNVTTDISDNMDVIDAIPRSLPDGSAAAPALAFSDDPDSGLYRAGSNQIRLVTGGTIRVTVDASQVQISRPLLITDGSAAAPALAFSSDPDTGIFRSSNNRVRFASGGADVFSVAGASIQVGTTLLFLDGNNVEVNTATGTKIGTATDQKLGFFNATPVTQRQGVAVSAAGIHAALVELGLITA